MSSFVVSARKYRPESFDSVVGQEHITQTLVNEIKNDRLAQSFLFCGPRGVGKTTCARILAKEINKSSVPEDYDYSYNIFELDAASHNSVDDIRALNEQVRIPPQTGEYKVYIIDEVHMLSSNAFNAFLKTLEEPPSYAIFILATTERHKILPTILSRCQIFNFDRIQIPQIVSHLQGIAKEEGIDAEEQALHLIALKADGAMRDALSIFDQMASFGTEGKITNDEVIANLNILDYEYYFKITDAFIESDMNEALLIFDDIQRNGFDGQVFLNGLANHFRDLLVSKTAKTHGLLEQSKEMAVRYYAQSNKLNASFLVNAINITGEYDLSYKQSRNQRLHIELCLIKLTSLQHAIDVTKKKKPKLEKLVATGYFTNYFDQEEGVNPQSPTKPSVSSKSTAKAAIDEVVPTVRLGSINSAITNASVKTEVKEKVVVQEEVKEKYAPLDAEKAKSVFTDIHQLYAKENKPSLSSFFADPIFELKNGGLLFTVGSNTFAQEITSEKHRIMRWINEAGFECADIQYSINAAKVAEYKLFTPEQRFDALAKEYPILTDFKQRFNLNFDE